MSMSGLFLTFPSHLLSSVFFTIHIEFYLSRSLLSSFSALESDSQRILASQSHLHDQLNRIWLVQ